jgi:hypothetical protein
MVGRIWAAAVILSSSLVGQLDSKSPSDDRTPDRLRVEGL